jgi:hypothetical protein
MRRPRCSSRQCSTTSSAGWIINCRRWTVAPPRQAAAEGGSVLAELHALLDDIQGRADNSGGGMSAARIRRHLGLTDA